MQNDINVPIGVLVGSVTSIPVMSLGGSTLSADSVSVSIAYVCDGKAKRAVETNTATFMVVNNL